MDLVLPSSEMQLKKECHLYLIKGGKWAALMSVFILVAMLANIAFQTSKVLLASNIILYMLPILLTIFAAGVVVRVYSTHEISNKAFLTYLFALEFSWLFLIWMIFDSSEDIFAGNAALAGVESIVDVLVLTFAIALFCDRKIMLMGVLPLMLLSFFLRVTEIPDNYFFPLTKFLCFFAIIVSGQRVLYTWFEKAIVRDVEKQHLLKHFRRMALVDGLTNISNRRHFDEILSQEIRAAERNNHPLCLILIDVDFFKRLNDSLGHQVGDDCLVALAKVLTGVANRPRDLAARYGGEEFVILLPDTDLDGSLKIAEKLKMLLAKAKISHPDSEVSQFVTVSQGVCQWKAEMGQEQLMESADKLLYKAKSSGRNQYMLE
ncbi:GGDEF domain-containing protein [Shewanella eurypsychrophilus]|uniref:diguanylate cyclase n=1 Tax=Shewanella eurypsychrophilus TaxID=2593656 RepID=A0ABX6V274_9GAMM|nr:MULTISPECIES: GGDEF domain-containing protein [Shewanella]QFU21414.1 diguanylate cyclase [Shewanella sp. YLB-09]QPG56704.1 GGDEF domain-containing protein [Shewanella eurypsychrophilus]